MKRSNVNKASDVLVPAAPEPEADFSDDEEEFEELDQSPVPEADDDDGDFEPGPAPPEPVQPDENAPSASFTVSNPLQGVPPATLLGVATVALSALLLRWLRKRKGRKKSSVDSSWAWHEPAPTGSGGGSSSGQSVDLSRPLQGSTLAIAEKCALPDALHCNLLRFCGTAAGAQFLQQRASSHCFSYPLNAACIFLVEWAL